jgi:hypothetical protein
MKTMEETVEMAQYWMKVNETSRTRPTTPEGIAIIKELLRQIGIGINFEKEYQLNERFICHGCGDKLERYNYEESIKRGKLRRMNVRGEFKTFHAKCFTVFARHSPEWYIIEDKGE